MSITRFTTPPMGLLVKGVDITDKTVYVTIEQGNVEITLSGDRLSMETQDEDTKITFALTQEQAGQLKTKSPASIQVNWINGGSRLATVVANVKVLDNLLDEVI